MVIVVCMGFFPHISIFFVPSSVTRAYFLLIGRKRQLKAKKIPNALSPFIQVNSVMVSCEACRTHNLGGYWLVHACI